MTCGQSTAATDVLNGDSTDMLLAHSVFKNMVCCALHAEMTEDVSTMLPHTPEPLHVH